MLPAGGAGRCYAPRMSDLDARLPDSFRLDRVDLTVANADRSVAFYREVLGLEPTGAGPDANAAIRTVEFGAAGTPIVRLHERPGVAPSPPNATGLFHLAILLPDRPSLADFVTRLARERTPVVGAADHAVSEAIYLNDPDGHGIEVYADRPRSAWPRQGGRIAMTTEPLDAENLATQARSDGSAPFRAPDGTALGHVHLRARDAAEARAFYTQRVGFDEVAAFPGATFLSVAGYHHHLGANEWESPGGAPAPEDAARLVEVRASVTERDAVAALRERLRSAGVHVTEDAERVVRFADPSGVPWRIAARA